MPYYKSRRRRNKHDFCRSFVRNNHDKKTLHHDTNCPKCNIRPSPSLKTQFWLTRHQCKYRESWLLDNAHILSSRFVFISLIISILIILVMPPIYSSEVTHSNILSQHNKNSGQFAIAQLCASKSQFPITKRVEGAVLSSNGDTDINCTITFRTKSSQQHFIIRFEELKLGCDDHLKMFDGDIDYGQPSIKDFSCRDSLASVPVMKTTGTYLTMRYSSDSKTKKGDGFRLVVTAIFDVPPWDCPVDYASCSSQGLCIAKSLFCDDINHCINNGDEENCSSKSSSDGSSSGSFFAGDLTLSNALGLLIVLVLIIVACVLAFIVAAYRRESDYAQYQHHIQRAIGVPLQTSSSLMFTNHQPQYHHFQPANFSPYITPQHHAITSTLPRGYSTLPLNMARQPQPFQSQQAQIQQLQHPTSILAKANNLVPNNNNNNEYLLMTGLTGPPTAAMQAAPTMQTNLFLPTSQSILTTSIRGLPTTQESTTTGTIGRR